MNSPIDLTNYNGLRDGKFRKALLQNIGESLFTIEDKQLLLYQLLLNVVPITLTLQNNTVALENACCEILNHFGLKSIPKAKLYQSNSSGGFSELPTKSPPQSYTDRFWKYIVRLRILPAIIFKEYIRIIDNDLAKIDVIIQWYESDKLIQDLVDNKAKPRNHEEKTKYDFYNRCIKERINIREYLDGEFKLNVLKVASDSLYSYLLMDKAFYREMILLPYDFARIDSIQFYDLRKLDHVMHRLLDIPSDEDKMIEIYSKDKLLFYNTLFERNKPGDIFSELYDILQHLPVENDRKGILDELRWLFENNRWIAFFALALSQVEGLLGEMNASAMSKGVLNAIPSKVRALRSVYDMSKYYFDYFEYQLPNLRNKFMHAGYETDYQIKSYDLLFDLRFLLKVFLKLDAPLIQLKVIWVRKSEADFQTVGQFANYFKLICALPKKEILKLSKCINLFAKDFLIGVYDQYNIVNGLIENLPGEIEFFFKELSQYFTFPLPDKELEAFLHDSTKLQEIVLFFAFKETEYEYIEDCHVFLCNYVKYINVPDNLKELRDIYALKLIWIMDIKKRVTASAKVSN